MDSVNITIKAKQTAPDGRVEHIHHRMHGQYAYKGGKHYLRYTDKQLDDKNAVPTTIKAAEGELLILRSGIVSAEQRFVLNGETRADYHTPYGVMELVMRTNRLQVSCDNNVGSVRLQYSLQANGSHAGDYELDIRYEPV